MVVYVFGHKSPDLDSVCSAIALAELKKKLGEDFVACVLGGVGGDSLFALEKFGFEIPQVLESGEGKDLFLVDHSDSSQSVDFLNEGEVLGVVDHHKLGDVSSSVPIEIFVRPVGCSCTVIKHMYDFYGVEISKGVAGIMLCAILSDTVVFRSPTTTEEDKEAAGVLAEIAGVSDVEGLGGEIFKIKSDIDGVSCEDLLMRDFKDFDVKGKKVGVGQLELSGLDDVLKIKSELLSEMNRVREDGYYAVFLMLTDILSEATLLLCVSDEEGLREKIFGESEEGLYKGMMSRKKQVVPKLEKFLIA